ncbi:lectin-like protein, partial [Cuspidothrix issatschenkoi]|uniref:lectin-like protein n=1 Tax=Cuspidothrix issatschenkoi TaxID=230752 RepID=UPI00223F6A33
MANFYQYNGSTYTLSNSGTWQQAQAEALRLGGNLVTINSQAEQDWLISTFGGTERLWIGLTDEVREGQFQWASGETSTYTNWYPGQPDNGGPTGENYVVINYDSAGKWNDYPNNLSPFRGIIEIQSPAIPAITLAVSSSSVLEDGSTNLLYTFTRTGSTTNALTVNYSIAGTANSSDYTGATPGTGKTITFAAGASTATLIIDPTSDSTIESNETVVLNLTSGTGYTIGTTTAVTGTITNDDTAIPAIPAITLAVSSSSVLEDGSTNLLYTFTRTGSTTNALTVNYSIAGTANSSDYTGATPGTGKTITFAAGASTATLIIDPTSDSTIESNETVVLTLTSGTGYTIGTTTAVTGTITNDDTGNNIFNGTSGNDNLIGTANNDILNGGAGNDTLNGGAGTDTLIGGTGNDTYIVDSATDTITENANEGTDTIQSSVNYTIAALANVENLTLTGTAANGTGNAGNNVITGNSANNTLDGGAGNDTLIGGAGTDTLIGGLGNDTYIVDSATDTITENASAGTDTIQSSVNYTIAANVENLTLTGTAANGTGNAGNNVITGNSANNTLNGGAGNDTLDGGAGTDTLIGGTGNDTYIVDSTNDIITENASAGIDTIQSGVNYTIAANVENLTLTGTAAINGTGNTGNNVITGNSGNNTLDGGAGTDTLIGGLGNDTYIVDSINDIITENASAGTDTIRSSVNYTIAALANVENLTLTGTAANGTGNAGNNVITGNSANNTLDGGAGNDTLDGGAGTDTLIGGLGNDTYIVDSTNDIITENPSADTDTIQSSVTYTIAANVENLTLTGTAAINGTGNAGNNVITGNSANNTLDGGAGTDTLIGGLGNDIYIVDSTNDIITENASAGTDTIQSSVNYTIAALANVENLTLTGTAAINGTGNIGNNVITGNSGNNTLDG